MPAQESQHHQHRHPPHSTHHKRTCALPLLIVSLVVAILLALDPPLGLFRPSTRTPDSHSPAAMSSGFIPRPSGKVSCALLLLLLLLVSPPRHPRTRSLSSALTLAYLFLTGSATLSTGASTPAPSSPSTSPSTTSPTSSTVRPSSLSCLRSGAVKLTTSPVYPCSFRRGQGGRRGQAHRRVVRRAGALRPPCARRRNLRLSPAPMAADAPPHSLRRSTTGPTRGTTRAGPTCTATSSSCTSSNSATARSRSSSRSAAGPTPRTAASPARSRPRQAAPASSRAPSRSSQTTASTGSTSTLSTRRTMRRRVTMSSCSGD